MNQPITHITLSSAFLTLLLFTSIVNSSKTAQLPLSNHKDDVTNSATLKLEARSEKENAIDLSTNVKSDKDTQIHTDSFESRSNDAKTKAPMQDSYLNALEYSHSSNNPREDIVKLDFKTKPSKVVRRTYDGPVYQPHTEYGPPKEPTTSYGAPDSEPIKSPRIIYGVPDAISPTPESFQPTPSYSYTLPSQQTSNFNNQNANADGKKYGAPSHINYGIPSAIYGIPSATYGPAPVPQKIYGPPKYSYLPASQPQQAYGPPQWSGFALPDLPQLPSLPSIDFSFPFALKLNAFTIAKIILKLIIFKMIVKFIAILCLILFIPKLEMKNEENSAEEDNESRKMASPYLSTQRLNDLTSMVSDSIEMYQRANGVIPNDGEQCKSVGCRMRSLLQSGETWNDYFKLFNNYVDEKKNGIATDNESPS